MKIELCLLLLTSLLVCCSAKTMDDQDSLDYLEKAVNSGLIEDDSHMDNRKSDEFQEMEQEFWNLINKDFLGETKPKETVDEEQVQGNEIPEKDVNDIEGQPKQPDFGIEEKIKKMMEEKSGKYFEYSARGVTFPPSMLEDKAKPLTGTNNKEMDKGNGKSYEFAVRDVTFSPRMVEPQAQGEEIPENEVDDKEGQPKQSDFGIEEKIKKMMEEKSGKSYEFAARDVTFSPRMVEPQEEIVVEAKPEAQPEDISDNEGYYIVLMNTQALQEYISWLYLGASVGDMGGRKDDSTQIDVPWLGELTPEKQTAGPVSVMIDETKQALRNVQSNLQETFKGWTVQDLLFVLMTGVCGTLLVFNLMGLLEKALNSNQQDNTIPYTTDYYTLKKEALPAHLPSYEECIYLDKDAVKGFEYVELKKEPLPQENKVQNI